MKPSYELETPPEEAVSWGEYARAITTEWSLILDRQPPAAETLVQDFLEKHPSMVPGAFGVSGAESGHCPRFCGLIAQPPLPSYDRRVPDFMWLSQCSDTEQPVLVEIEAPSKRWFTKAGKQTEQLTQALNQIAEWKAWFDVPHNVEAFKHFYCLDVDAWRRRHFRPAYLLIYGRRFEADANPTLTAKRRHLHPDDVVSMTYDRLQPNPKASDLVCFKAEGPRTFRVVSVPVTLAWSPSMEEERAHLHGWKSAIDANSDISPARRAFLVRRRPYWDAWASGERHGWRSVGDEE